MNIGDVIHFHDFGFDDGGHANKLLVVISSPSEKSIVMLITTSKGNLKQHGCQPAAKKYFIPQGVRLGFPKDTWFDLARNAIVRDTVKIMAVLQSGGAGIVNTLPTQVVSEIKNCLTKYALESLTREACELLGVKPKW